jgi:glutathione S-transferase
LAEVAAFLLSDAASHVTGQSWAVDGGSSRHAFSWRMRMALKYYHAEPVANSLKSMIPLKEKGLRYESVYVDLHKFEQHQPWFVAINPEGQVPVLEHDGTIVTHTTVINEYLEDVFPDATAGLRPLRPRDAAGGAYAILEQVH